MQQAIRWLTVCCHPMTLSASAAANLTVPFASKYGLAKLILPAGKEGCAIRSMREDERLLG